MAQLPTTLLQAIQYFSDDRKCFEFVKNLHWPDGNVTCSHCGSQHVKELSTRPLFKCYDCKKQTSVRVGTIFEDSPLPLQKWLTAMWLVMNCKNGVSSHEISRSIGVTQKTAWFLLMRIREAMRSGSFVKLAGVVEADETYLGMKVKNMHVRKRMKSQQGAKGNKTIVMGMVERGGRVVAKVLDDTKGNRLQAEVLNTVEHGATLYTDDLNAYKGLGKVYTHESVNHNWEYVRGNAHTNTIEGYWSLFKRTLRGTYIHMAPFHLDRYLDEQGMRYDLRKGTDGSRFQTVASQVIGRRLTWNELTGKTL